MRKHIGKIGRQSLGESRTVKGWMGDGSRWQAIIPHPTGENIHKLEAEITAALGTDDWGLQNNLGLWAVAKKAAKARAADMTTPCGNCLYFSPALPPGYCSHPQEPTFPTHQQIDTLSATGQPIPPCPGFVDWPSLLAGIEV